MRMYEVGGCVRDEILGTPSKDIDFTVVLDGEDRFVHDSAFYNDPFRVMVINLERRGFKVFLETPEYLTVRAQFPDNYFTTPAPAGSAVPVLKMRKGLTADFVLARKEADYTDGRRPDRVIPGTLEDDLARRDFTMNAIAKDGENFVDPFNGRADIDARLIRAVGDPRERLNEDALRAVRALRFSLTKNMRIEGELDKVLHFDMKVLDAVANKISSERIAEELEKMFRFNTMKTLRILQRYPALTEAMFAGRVNLLPTLKSKGFK